MKATRAAREVSRFARKSPDWQQLIDQATVYAPRAPSSIISGRS